MSPPCVSEVNKTILTLIALTPGELRAFLALEITRWDRFVELVGIPKK